MSRTVVFLGTDASKALDLPLTNEIFPRLLERLMPEPTAWPPLFRDDQEAREGLWRCLAAFMPGLSEIISGSQDRAAWEKLLPPITDVLSTLDHALLSGNSPGPDFTSFESCEEFNPLRLKAEYRASSIAGLKRYSVEAILKRQINRPSSSTYARRSGRASS
jgi:hypothetical protein